MLLKTVPHNNTARCEGTHVVTVVGEPLSLYHRPPQHLHDRAGLPMMMQKGYISIQSRHVLHTTQKKL